MARLLLASVIGAPGFRATPVAAQAPAPPPNPLDRGIAEDPRRDAGSVSASRLATTASGKMVIFAWFENKKAALAWYYSDVHQKLMKMGGGPVATAWPAG